MLRISLTPFLAAGALAAALPVQAEGWTHEFAPYVLAAGMDGTAGVGNVSADVNVSFSDILSNLKFGAMAAYRGSTGPYFVQVDGIYMKLAADKTGPNGLLFGDAEVDQTLLEADFGYAVTEQIGVFAGARYNNLDMDVSATGPLNNTLSASRTESWVDPLLGARAEVPLGEKWSASLRGDIGGFGVGADFAWQAVAALRWQTSERIGVLFAYRYLDVDYEDGSGSGFFKYDVATSGPGVAAVFTF
jgi:hypothetical protein